ncbi:hypothetical protein GCM10007857_19840 [Bradyrhizobium iriomotense]|uniref:Transposase n=1 Tax=Bradyrhizobium iriomotense TaxID=441950 RepID=A0ABQ6ASY1_9BRAD|nr:hypothetical protein GCM10007857_19840 [Bradyrhizobium iriomotense]
MTMWPLALLDSTVLAGPLEHRDRDETRHGQRLISRKQAETGKWKSADHNLRLYIGALLI